VNVASTEGVGTTFTVDIPLGSAHLPQERIQRPRARTSTALGATPFVDEVERSLPVSAERAAAHVAAHVGAGAADDAVATSDVAQSRVLVVDDNADMREYLSALLSPHYTVAVAADGAAALEHVRLDRPDLVVSDIMMPGLDGFGLVEALRAEPETAAVPIILLSARAGEESTVEGLASGADDYLVKPFAARELLARVRAHLKLSEAIRRERARLVSFFDRAPAFMAVLRGPEHVFEAANAAYLTLVGRGDLVGRRLLDALPELAGQGYRELLDGVFSTGIPHVGREARVMLMRATGGEPEESFVDFVYQPIHEADGRVSGIFVQGVDVTDQVRARQELERMYVSVRDANEAKRQFLAAMSHELRTPLNAVIGYADLLALGVRGDLSDVQRADVDRISSASRYLLTLISDILDFSRVEAGHITLQSGPVSIAALTSSVSSLMQPHIAERGIQFEVEPVDRALTAIADQERLQQILLNLLMNASKFTPAGGRIRLWAEPCGAEVHLHVHDTGVGPPSWSTSSSRSCSSTGAGAPSRSKASASVSPSVAISRDAWAATCASRARTATVHASPSSSRGRSRAARGTRTSTTLLLPEVAVRCADVDRRSAAGAVVLPALEQQGRLAVGARAIVRDVAGERSAGHAQRRRRAVGRV
jgi:signal transduction histidine kinase